MTSSRSSSAAFTVLSQSACHAAFGSAARASEELKMIGNRKPIAATLSTKRCYHTSAFSRRVITCY